MIVSDTVELKIDLPVTNSKIEGKLTKLNLDIVRWAVSDINNDTVFLQISYLKK